MKISITGHRGRVGKYFRSYPDVSILDCDILNPLQIERAIRDTKPDIVVHLAGKSNVDYCEIKGNQDSVIETNVRGTYFVAREVEKYGCSMVFISSDHVFSGSRWLGKYNEDEIPNPVNFYGMSKMGAEGFRFLFNQFKVIRTSSLFNADRLYLEIKKMEDTYYPTFLKRSFLYIPHFCQLLHNYCYRFHNMPKVLHLAGVDSVSYFDFMEDVAKEWKIVGEVKKRRKEVLGDEWAPRGHNLGLDIALATRLGFPKFSYLDGIKEMSKVEPFK